MAIAKLVPFDEPETYHGLPVLTLHVGDPLPVPPFPARYALSVSPDLARYLLTFNHTNNRHVRPRLVRRLASDMTSDRWFLSPSGLVFDISGCLNDGQHRLSAVAESGSTVWMVADFGWPIGIIRAIDRGAIKTTADMLGVADVDNASTLAAAYTLVWQYEQLVGLSRSLAGFDVPSSIEAQDAIESDMAAWQEATSRARRTYTGLDKGASTKTWAAFYYLIGRTSPEKAAEFFVEVHEGTGTPKSSTRQLADWFRRRPANATKTGDNREPIEVMIRAWNGWLVGRSFAFPKYRGFEWSRIRSPR